MTRPTLYRSAFGSTLTVSPADVLAFHRATFGAARMEGEGAPAPGTDPGAPPPPAAPAPPAQPAPGEQPPAAERVEDLPEWAQRVIREARGEAATRRTALSAAEQARQDAERQRTELMANLAKALGVPGADDGKGSQPDPAQLTSQLQAEQTAARQARVELAVYRAAGQHNGDPSALLDSRSFLAKVADLDPTADDFAAKVGEAIKGAVADNPKLRAAGRAPGASGADHSAGGTGQRQARTPVPLDQAVGAFYGV